MTSIDLPLTEALEQFVARRAAAEGYASGKDFILALLEQLRQREERDDLEAQLLEGVAALNRGDGQPMTAADWQRLRANVVA